MISVDLLSFRLPQDGCTSTFYTPACQEKTAHPPSILLSVKRRFYIHLPSSCLSREGFTSTFHPLSVKRRLYIHLTSSCLSRGGCTSTFHSRVSQEKAVHPPFIFPSLKRRLYIHLPSSCLSTEGFKYTFHPPVYQEKLVQLLSTFCLKRCCIYNVSSRLSREGCTVIAHLSACKEKDVHLPSVLMHAKRRLHS